MGEYRYLSEGTPNTWEIGPHIAAHATIGYAVCETAATCSVF